MAKTKGAISRITIGRRAKIIPPLNEPDAVELLWLRTKWWARKFQQLDNVRGDERNEAAIERALEKMGDAAKEVAPYQRPRLSAVKVFAPGEEPAGHEPVVVTLLASGTATKLIDGEVVEVNGKPVRQGNGKDHAS